MTQGQAGQVILRKDSINAIIIRFCSQTRRSQLVLKTFFNEVMFMIYINSKPGFGQEVLLIKLNYTFTFLYSSVAYND